MLQNLSAKGNIPTGGFAPEDSAAVASIKIFAQSRSIYTVEPLLLKKGGDYISYPDTVTAENLVIQLQKASGNKAELGIKESDALMKYVTLKVYKFPFIIVLWLGTLIMVIGFMMSVVRRVQNNRLR